MRSWKPEAVLFNLDTLAPRTEHNCVSDKSTEGTQAIQRRVALLNASAWHSDRHTVGAQYLLNLQQMGYLPFWGRWNFPVFPDQLTSLFL